MSYDYPEPTDEELLQYAIEDDAEDSDSRRLLHRQAQNWALLEDRVLGTKKTPSRYDQLLKDFNQHRGFRAAQWWDLVTIYPELHPDEIFGPNWTGQIDSRTDYDDINSYGYAERTTTLIRDRRIWLDLETRSQRAWLDLLRELADDDGMVRAPLEGPGWWQSEPSKIHMPIQSVMQYRPMLHVLLSIKAQHCPPVAGEKTCWLPSLIGYEEGASW